MLPRNRAFEDRAGRASAGEPAGRWTVLKQLALVAGAIDRLLSMSMRTIRGGPPSLRRHAPSAWAISSNVLPAFRSAALQLRETDELISATRSATCWSGWRAPIRCRMAMRLGVAFARTSSSKSTPMLPRPRPAPVLDDVARRDRADALWPCDRRHAHPRPVVADDLREATAARRGRAHDVPCPDPGEFHRPTSLGSRYETAAGRSVGFGEDSNARVNTAA